MLAARISQLSVLPRLLGVAFAVSWGVAALYPWDGVCTLAITGSAACLPYFFLRIGKRVAQNLLIYIALVFVALIFPPLWPLAAVWASLCLLMKLGLLLYNLPLILLGLVVYLITAFLPHALLTAGLRLLDGSGLEILVILIGLLGAWVFLLLMSLLGRLRCDPTRGAAFMLGFGSYLALLLLTFLVPGGDGSSDG
jgi:hypothetical protein